MATVEELEKRVATLEAELTCLMNYVATQMQPPIEQRWWGNVPPDKVPQMIRDAWASQPALTVASIKTMAKMGLTELPVGHEELMRMMLESGIKPEDNILSREIIAMREE